VPPEGWQNMNWFDPNDIQQNKGLAWLAYLGLFFLVPLLAKPESRFCRAHTNQGILLVLAWVACFIFTVIISIIPFIGWIIGILLVLALLVYNIIKIVEALQGKYSELLVVGKIHILK
jgi:uncharacterized membrane protein